MYYLFSWNEHSEGAKALAGEMGIKRIKHERSKFKGSARKTVINWGCGRALPEEVGKCRILNYPGVVATVSNKLTFFRKMSESNDAPRIPEFTDDLPSAREWLVNGETVCARQRLQGSGAEGLVILGPDNAAQWVAAPLYTKYVKKIAEYRVHIVNREVLSIQKKALRPDFEGEPNFQIRNLENGFIYARNGFDVPDDVSTQALKAMAASGLDFGACDVIYNQRQNQAYVLEINSAPGLCGSTITEYAQALRRV